MKRGGEGKENETTHTGLLNLGKGYIWEFYGYPHKVFMHLKLLKSLKVKEK